MKKRYSLLSSGIFLIALALSVSACSSSQTGDSEFGDDVPADAGTDAVPAEHAENAAPADGTQDPAQAQASNSDQQQAPAPDAVVSTDPQQAPPPADGQVPPPAQPQEQAQAQTQTPPPAQPDANAVAATTPPTEAMPVAQAPAETTPPASTDSSSSSSLTASSTDSSSSSTSSSSSGSDTYSVRRGDTLMRIAFEKYGDLYKWKAIYEANRDKIKDPNVIRPGTVLTLENVNTNLPARTGKRYMIKQGDTLVRISTDVYGTPKKWKKIWEHNKPWIPNPNKIFAGFYLYYTGGKNPEDIERHEEENPVAPMAQDPGSEQETTPREPASQNAPVAK